VYAENESFCVAGACFVTDSVSSSSSSSSGSQSVSQSVAAPTPTRNADTRPVQHMHVVPPPPPSVATASAVLHRASERASALINDPAGVAERQQLAAVGDPVARGPPARPPAARRLRRRFLITTRIRVHWPTDRPTGCCVQPRELSWFGPCRPSAAGRAAQSSRYPDESSPNYWRTTTLQTLVELYSSSQTTLATRLEM